MKIESSISVHFTSLSEGSVKEYSTVINGEPLSIKVYYHGDGSFHFITLNTSVAILSYNHYETTTIVEALSKIYTDDTVVLNLVDWSVMLNGTTYPISTVNIYKH